MKTTKIIFVASVLMLTVSFSSLAQQEDRNGFSVSFGVGYFGFLNSSGFHYDFGNVSFENELEKQSQISLNGDVALHSDSYIFSFYFAKGLIDPIPYKQVNYSEYNLTVGMGISITTWFALEGHVGVGYFKIYEKYGPEQPTEKSGTIGFPFRIKANFYLSKNFAIGINPNANFNFYGSSSLACINIISQIRF